MQQHKQAICLICFFSLHCSFSGLIWGLSPKNKTSPAKIKQGSPALAGRGSAPSDCLWAVNAAAKVFLVQHSTILQAEFDDVSLIGAVGCGQIELAPSP